MMPGAGAVARVVAGGLTRRRVQSLVIGLVLLVSTGACVLALALVADSSAPFDRAFAAQHGADVVASVDRAVALVAGLLAVPAGVAVHRYVLPVMAHAAGTGVPPATWLSTRHGRSPRWPWPAWSSRRAGEWFLPPAPPGLARWSRCTPSEAAAWRP
jgi:hypothetical protein